MFASTWMPFTSCHGVEASNKGKYIALAVLLPRIGALQSITLCPSLVKQLVCAVGVRGNVSGQATSLLLQLLDSLKQEVRYPSSSYLIYYTLDASNSCTVWDCMGQDSCAFVNVDRKLLTLTGYPWRKFFRYGDKRLSRLRS